MNRHLKKIITIALDAQKLGALYGPSVSPKSFTVDYRLQQTQALLLPSFPIIGHGMAFVHLALIHTQCTMLMINLAPASRKEGVSRHNSGGTCGEPFWILEQVTGGIT